MRKNLHRPGVSGLDRLARRTDPRTARASTSGPASHRRGPRDGPIILELLPPGTWAYNQQVPATVHGPVVRMPMSSEGSITSCLGRLKAGDQAAAQRLWEAYAHRLITLARTRLRGLPRVRC